MTIASTASGAALITGAASGIGRAVARRLAGQGWSLALLDRDAAGLDALAGDLRAARRVEAFPVDVRDYDAVAAAFEGAAEVFGTLDAAVHSAGVDRLGTVEQCSPEDWRFVLSVNLDGAFHVCKCAIPHLRDGGRIVAVASTLAKSGMAGHAPYAASKFGVLGLVQSLARELAPRRITVNAVCPGAVDETQMRAIADAEAIAHGLPPAAERVHLIPLGRMALPEDVAGTVSFLLSADAGYVTGQAINVNGGLLSH